MIHDIIEHDPQLHSILPNHPIIVYYKTESLKDILIHSHQAKTNSILPNHPITVYYKTESLKGILINSCQAKPTYLHHKTTPKQNH